jgi:hypothetical protein
MMADYDNGAYLTPIAIEANMHLGQYFFMPNTVTSYTSFQNRFPDDTSVGLDSGTAALQLYYPQKAGATDSVIFESHHLPVVSRVRGKQLVHLSGANEPSVYDSGHKDRLYEITVRNINETKMERLQIFLCNIVKFQLNQFDLEDQSNTVYTCRWWEQELPRVMHHDLLYDVTFVCWVESITE